MRSKIIYTLSFAGLLTLFIITALLSYGYEDEIYTFFMIEKLDSLWSIISYINREDFHPAGMYVIDYILLKLSGNWNIVKSIIGALAACTVWLYWYIMSRNIQSRLVLLFSFIVICLNPSVLLWCTSIRWYAYLMPLVCIISLLVHFSGKENINALTFWTAYFITCLAMFYINYISAVIILVSFVFTLYRRRKYLHSEWKSLVSLSILSLCLVSYQIYILFSVHIGNALSRHAGIKFSIAGAMNYLQGSAVIPVSAYGILFIVANLILIVVFLKNIVYIISDCNNNFFMASYGAVMLTFPGAIKDVRNFVILSPEQGVFLTNIYSQIKHKFLKVLVIAMFAAATAGGLFNVITHNNTAKVTYNMPYGEILNFIDEIDPEAHAHFITNLPGMYYFAKDKYSEAVLVPDGFAKTDILAPFFPDWLDTLKHWKGKIIAVRTHRSLVSKDDFRAYTEYLDSANVIKKHGIGYDKFAAFKRRFYSEYPDYYATVYFIDNGGAQ